MDSYEKIGDDTDEGFVKFSIYNWKDGNIPTEEYDWHIGGYGFDAVDENDATEIIELLVHCRIEILSAVDMMQYCTTALTPRYLI